jgi:cytochrome c oxidase subunit III
MSEAAAHGHAHGEHRFLAHHFASLDRQVDASRLGMWLFLSTEVLLFVGLFVAYSVYRYSFPNAWAQASRHSEIWAGTTNTFVLITSSLTVALAIHFARENKPRTSALMLGITLVFGLVFMGIKGIEYWNHFHEGALPGKYYHLHEVMLPGVSMYWSLYFLMTGLHGLHVLIGMTVLSVCMYRVLHGYYDSGYYVGLELGGLYWHLVDLIWIFLFPLIYLV